MTDDVSSRARLAEQLEKRADDLVMGLNAKMMHEPHANADEIIADVRELCSLLETAWMLQLDEDEEPEEQPHGNSAPTWK